MRKFIYLGIITSLLIGNTYGQGAATRNTYAWSLGVHTGVTTYFGDLNYKYFLPNRNDIMSGKNLSALDSRSVGVSLEKRLSGALSLTLNGLYGNVTGNDRTQNWGGSLVTDNPNFARSLNFRTEFYDANLSLTYNGANGFLIRKNARFSPYLSAGIGVTSFFVFGDLYTKDAGRYHYWTDGTIKDIAQNDPNAANAVEIAQDGAYETRTTNWKTEGKAYPTQVLNIPVALGVKYRMADRWDLSLQASARYLFSDYFDDVSGAKYPEVYDSPQHAYISNPNAANWSTKVHEFRGNTNNQNDIYGALTLGISYRFGMSLRKFRGPHFYSQAPYRKPEPAPVMTASNTNQPVVVNVNGTPTTTTIVNPDERVGEMEQQIKDMQAMQGANADAMKALNDEMLALKTEKTKLDNSSSQPTANNAELMGKIANLEARMDSVREAEIESQDNKINDLELRLAQMEARRDTVGASALRKEVSESKKNKEKLRRQRKSSNVEVKKLQEQVNEMSAKMEAMAKQTPVAPAKDPEVLKLRTEMEYMRAEMERLRTQQPTMIQQPAQQPIIIQQPAQAQTPAQAQPIIINNPAQTAAPQTPTIIQQQPMNNAQLDQMNRTLDQMSRTLDMMSGRLNNLENKQPTIIQQPAAPAAAPIIVNTPTPAPAQTTTNTYVSQVNIGLNRAPVYFGNGSSAVSRQDYATLDAIVNELQKDGGLLCSVIGYASTNGNAAQNKALSEKRAQNVKNYMVAKGVNASRILTDALGSTSPVYNSNLDRRVEITILNR